MTFVFVTAMAHYRWAGSEELWSLAALRLRQRGHRVAALVPRYEPLAPRLQELRAAGVAIQLRADPRAGWPFRALRRRLGRWLPAEDPDLAWIRDQRPDLVCVSNGNYFDGLGYLECCARRGIPFVSLAQANAEWLWPDDSMAERIAAVYRQARGAFFVSAANRRLAETQLGVALPMAEVVRNPFSVPRDAAPAWPGEDGTVRLACVGRYEPSAKGQDLLLEVLATEKWRVRPLVVSLFGAGPMERSLARLRAALRLEGRVEFRGHVPEVEAIWRTHHALVLPSRYEGLPLAVVEAMWCGRPVIVTDVAGNAELLEDNVTGFVAAAPTARHLDEALERAWARRAEWCGMGRRAAEAVRRAVPEDPAAVFAERLAALARG